MNKALLICLILLGLAVLIYFIIILSFTLQRNNKVWSRHSWTSSAALLNTLVSASFAINLERNHAKGNHIQRMMSSLELPRPKLWKGHDAKTEGLGGRCPNLSNRSTGEVGCSISHSALMDHIGSYPPDKWVLVFEDDAVPSSDDLEETRSMMVEALDRAHKEGRPAVYLGFCKQRGEWWTGKRLDRHRWSFPVACLHAYAIKPEAARRFSKAIKKEWCTEPVDQVAKPALKGACLVAHRPFKIWLPGSQFMRKEKYEHGQGLFGQRRGDGFGSDIVKL